MSKLRTSQRVTVRHVTEGTGIERSVYLDYEDGKINPSDEHLKLISNFFGVSVERLLGDDIERGSIRICHCGKTEHTPEEMDDIYDAVRSVLEERKKRGIG